MNDSMTYAGVGVNYDAMDPFKRAAQLAARDTAGPLIRFGFSEYEPSRGESVYLVKTPFGYLAHVEEGLGTKNLVADAMYALTGKSYYDQVAQDGLAMIVNDMVTLGAMPVSAAMHLAVGDSAWFDDELRSRDLIRGWAKACGEAGCVWAGGETPTLKGMVNPSTAILSGSAVGIIQAEELPIKGDVSHGDVIVLIRSTGIGANGLTMAREIASRLPEGYLTLLPDGRAYGETLLDPTPIYVSLVEDCLKGGVNLHYAVNITGHGWRKLMRLDAPFSYVIDTLPVQLPIFDFIQELGPVGDSEAYGNLNMGSGFALYIPESDIPKFESAVRHYGNLDPVYAGHVEKSGAKKVQILPKGIEFLAETLGVR